MTSDPGSGQACSSDCDQTCGDSCTSGPAADRANSACCSVQTPDVQYDPAASGARSLSGAMQSAESWARGPHDKSNWLLQGRVVVGGWPFRLPKGRGSAGESEEYGMAKLASIVEAGVSTFVTLTEKGEVRGKPYAYNTFR
eukprot:gnl/TRDRNA2_/TRDRNA2_37088_c0_seq1.p1 gnl/TRDRNA2_/TRDRNA2_37088_c0~~gnl/TRDRNA2_/TRDRNA2_37088_c0_seq1.p1  ORF type:complete len:141 (-),score=10.53 gnl/TRDRNA2_/TRDRNA2_37088_c0_seq1:18-440(-)